MSPHIDIGITSKMPPDPTIRRTR